MLKRSIRDDRVAIERSCLVCLGLGWSDLSRGSGAFLEVYAVFPKP